MTLKDQWLVVKKNWLLALLLILLVVVPWVSRPLQQGLIPEFATTGSAPLMEKGLARDMIIYDPSFAPEVLERKVTTDAYLTSEVERDTFPEQLQRVKAIVTTTDSIVVSENVQRYGQDYPYYVGYFQIEVESSKYDAVLSQLREIGAVVSFSENRQDITAQYTNVEVELAAEKARLQRYQQLFEQATTSEKLEISDRIFEQERRVKYLEEQLQHQGEQVSYSTITVQLQEKQSSYIGITLVTFADLVRGIVQSINTALLLLVKVIPYALLALVVWIVVRIVKRKS